MAEPKSGSDSRRKQRTQRSGPQERQPDLETTIEDEMEASGRTSVVPRMAVVGIRPEAVAKVSADLDEVNLPPPEGAETGPTRLAEERERVRHELQREMGVLPAGTDGRLQQRKGRATREALDEAGVRADQLVRAQQPNAGQEAEVSPFFARANRWVQARPRGLMAAAAAVILVGAGTAYATMRRH